VDSDDFHHPTSRITNEVMEVTKALSWLETQAFTNVCFLSESMSMFRKLDDD
jgi:ribonuclease HI